jgi:hypothetical protein
MAAGDIVYASDFPTSMCHLVQASGAAQTGWTTLVATAITFGAGSEIIDTEALHDTGSNTSRIVIGKRLGWWEVSGLYSPAQNANQLQARAIIYKNGSAINGSYGGFGANAGAVFQGIATPKILVEATVSTDYVELMGLMQAASGTIGTSVNTYITSSFTAVWRKRS